MLMIKLWMLLALAFLPVSQASAVSKQNLFLFTAVSSFVNGHSTTFNGSSQYVDYGNHGDQAYNHAMTLSCWLKPNSTSTGAAYRTYFGKAVVSPAYAGWECQQKDQKVSCSRGVDNTHYTEIDTSGNQLTSSSSWFHVMFTDSGAGNTAGQKIYVGGSSVAVTSVNDTLGTGSTSNSGGLRVGNRGAIFWAGKAQNCALWDADESANIAAIYNSGTPVSIAAIDASHLKFWTRLGDGDSNGTNTWIDNSSSGWNGTDTATPSITTDHP